MDVPARRLHLGDKSSLPVQPLSGTVQSVPRVFQELHRSMSLLLFMSHRKIKKVTFSFLVRSLYYIECPLDFSFTLDGFMPCPTFRAVQRSRLDVSHDSPLLAPSVWPRRETSAPQSRSSRRQTIETPIQLVQHAKNRMSRPPVRARPCVNRLTRRVSSFLEVDTFANDFARRRVWRTRDASHVDLKLVLDFLR